jgi:hypothetical protein
MNAASLVALVAVAAVACGQARDNPAAGSEPVTAPKSPPKAAEVEAAKPADLTPDAYVVVTGVGLMQVKGPRELEGKPGIKFSNSHTGMGYAIDLVSAKDPAIVRAVISKAEAERRLALLEDTTPVTDTRSAKERYVERTRTVARGTDLQQLALLRAAYASTFAAGARNMDIYYLEEQVLPELAFVLGTDQDKLVEKLHAVHAKRGTYAATAKPRPAEPDPVPPKDPWGIKGHAYVGTFTLQGDSLIFGDPIYVTSKHDEPPQDVTKNAHVPATAGRWLCYLELDPEDPQDVTVSFIAIHESARQQFAGARRKAVSVAKLWVDSGQMSVVDAAIRDDAAYDDARLFGADDLGVIAGRGCKVTSGGGDGTYTTRVLSRDGKAIYVHVDFTGESRDFLKDARSKLKL